MVSILTIMNGALGWCKATRLASTSDNSKARRELGEKWDDTLAYMIKGGMWNWASRHTTLTGSTNDIVGTGYTFSAAAPSDYSRIVKISANERYDPTLDDFEEITSSTGGMYFRSYTTPIYLKYVSNSTDYGANPTKWGMAPEWVKAFELELAVRCGLRIASMKESEHTKLVKMAASAMKRAHGADAVNQPASHLPEGRLAQSRRSGIGTNNRMRKVGYPGG